MFRRWRVHPGVSDPDAWRNRAHFPEFHGYGEAWPAPEEVKRELAWWQGRTGGVWARNRLRAENRWMGKYRIANPHGVLGGHTLPDLSILLENGIAELRARIAERLEKAPPAKHDEYAAMDRCLGGLSVHCRNLAAGARRAAESAQDPACRAQLLSPCVNLSSRKPTWRRSGYWPHLPMA